MYSLYPDTSLFEEEWASINSKFTHPSFLKTIYSDISNELLIVTPDTELETELFFNIIEYRDSFSLVVFVDISILSVLPFEQHENIVVLCRAFKYLLPQLPYENQDSDKWFSELYEETLKLLTRSQRIFVLKYIKQPHFYLYKN